MHICVKRRTFFSGFCSQSQFVDEPKNIDKPQNAQLPLFFFPLSRLQSMNGKQQTPISTATVSMVHSVPELMVSSEVSHMMEIHGRQS